jgi:hypothetical protein
MKFLFLATIMMIFTSNGFAKQDKPCTYGTATSTTAINNLPCTDANGGKWSNVRGVPVKAAPISK